MRRSWPSWGHSPARTSWASSSGCTSSRPARPGCEGRRHPAYNHFETCPDTATQLRTRPRRARARGTRPGRHPTRTLHGGEPGRRPSPTCHYHKRTSHHSQRRGPGARTPRSLRPSTCCPRRWISAAL
eukprot:7110987-Pyramimonas_sp.AAC.1